MTIVEQLPYAVEAGFLAFAARRLLTYLHIFQQDEYNAARFLPWLWQKHAFDRRVSIGLLLASLTGTSVLALGVLLAAFWLEPNPCKDAKKPLKLTERAKRIAAVAWGLLAVILITILTYYDIPLWLYIVAVQSIPLALVVANIVLRPYEGHVQKKFWHAAHDKLNKIHPDVIGITGSFGKTSIKHLLKHVLQTEAPTFATQGSINTPMGVSRALREEMPENCRYYIGEMGAYGVGSIGRLCRLTPPHHGILSAIGAAHYERFKSLDNVARAKFELAEWVLKANGKMIISEQVLEQPYAQAFVDKQRSNFIVCGVSEGSDLRIMQSQQTAEGTCVDLLWQGTIHRVQAPLWGHHQAINIALVFAMSLNLGLTAQHVAIALRSAPQTTHRLEIKPQPDGSIYIDDAYNSNIVGFSSALETLTLLRKEMGRRILVTPGMAELGAAHDAQHAEIAAKAADCTDIILAVKPERIPTFVKPLAEKMGENFLQFPSFAEAQKWLKTNVRQNDVVLLENDLPDLYEKKLQL